MSHLKQFLWIFILLCLWQMLQCIKDIEARRPRYYLPPPPPQRTTAIDVKEKILELQCYAKLKIDRLPDLECCKINIMKQQRRGFCPSRQSTVIFTNIAPLQKLSCLDTCDYDFDCPVVQKCCESNSCDGRICVNAFGLRDDILLPPIPKISNVKESKNHKVEITVESSANSTHYYHFETRWHVGLIFSPRKLGKWMYQHVEKIAEIPDINSKRTDFSFSLKPGRWYQVRVAAINAFGFRGYSEPSKPFRLPTYPKSPKMPSDLKVVSARINNDTFYTIKIEWCPSKSNLPIEKYKVTWSLYVKGNNNDGSLVSDEAYVKDAHQYEITKLWPESSYYIQVQAISISGDRRLKSEKCSMLFNTTTTAIQYVPLKCSTRHYPTKYNVDEDHKNNDSNLNPLPTHRNSSTLNLAHNTSDYDVRFRLNRKIGMIVQISGFHPHKERVYEICPEGTNCEQREYTAIRAKKDSLEFSKLKYNTKYVLKPFKINGTDSDAKRPFTFRTPKCENFRKRFPKTQIKC